MSDTDGKKRLTEGGITRYHRPRKQKNKQIIHGVQESCHEL